MSFNFLEEVLRIGNGSSTPQFQFYNRNFRLGPRASGPTWRDIILHGNTALTLVNAKADSLEYLKLFGDTELLPETYLDTVVLSGGCEQRNLPSGFTQVEYLEIATEGVYFSTGINATIDTDMGITASNITSSSAQLLIAQCISGVDYFRIAKAGSTQRVIGSLGSSTVTDNNTEGINKFTARINKSGLYVNGSLVGTFSNVPSSLTGVGEVDIFRGKYSDFVYFAYAGSRFHSVWVDDNIFLPCRRNSDNQLGIYNTKTGEFILPSGTGSFTAGADVTTPSPDTPLNIVCNNGVLKVSKNLFNKNTVVTGKMLNADGSLVNGTDLVASDFIPVQTGVTYIRSYNGEPASNSYLTYNSSKTFIETLSPGTGIPFTIGSGVAYIRYNVRVDSLDIAQLEQGSTATQYRPYGQIYTDGTVEVVTDSLGNTANAERLRAVGDYKDTQEVISGSVTRNIGIKVLDGTETWKLSGGSNDLVVITGATSAWGAIAGVGGFCTHLTVLKSGETTFAGACRFATDFNIYDFRTAFGVNDVTGFKQFLATQYANGTPVIIVYPLAEATTESVSGQFLSKSPVTQTAGSISNLPIAITESEKTVPTPTQPLPINCNNGVLGIDSQGNITVTGTTETVEIDTTGDTATAENLFKVGTYQDVQSVIDGGVTRNVGIKVLDGTENWQTDAYDGYRRFYITNFAKRGYSIVFCTHYDSDISVISQYNNCYISSTGTFAIAISAEQTFTTVEQWKQYLSDQYANGTPVIIVYPLATPTTETVTAQPMNINAGTNVVQITESSMDNLALEVKYKGTL